MHGVLLDIDGTLVLSNDAHAAAWVEAFAHYNYSIKFDDVRKLIGMGGDKVIPKLVPELMAAEGHGKEISKFRSQLFLDKYAPHLKAAPGSRDLVKMLQANGVQLVVATSAKQAELQTLLKAAQVDDLLTQTTTSDDADNSKPDPDIVHAALQKLKVPAEHTLMLGDTPYDIEAAARAGVGLIALRCGGWSDSDLKGAIAIYNDPADVVAHYDETLLAHKIDN
jgi:HAD superfamily hydrolase (TIGR01509 family)